MITFDDENYVKNLPDCYKKNSDSNNYKILNIERLPIVKLKNDSQEVYNSLDIQQAKGKTLDLYGDMAGQARGVATDEQYILMILSKMMRNLSTGDYASVIKAIYTTFSCDPAEVLIIEKDDPATVELVVLPLRVINRAGLTTRQTVELIKHLMPAGVKLESFLFEGTFEFCETEDEMSIDGDTKGFCDIEGGTLGGYLGITYGEDDEPILPID